jgi:hypothetical protein
VEKYTATLNFSAITAPLIVAATHQQRPIVRRKLKQITWVFIKIQCKDSIVIIVSWTFLIQGVPGGKVNILGVHSIGHSKQKTLYEHVSYSERFPR